MQSIFYGRFFLALLMVLWAAPAFADDAQNKINPDDLCKGRAGCRMLWSSLAASKDNRRYVISEIVLPHPVKNDWEKCHRPQDDRYGEFLDNVSQEIWLTELGGLLPSHRKLLEFCNNGYGAAALGEDKISFTDSELTYRQSGGGNDRWVWARSYALPGLKYDKTLLCDFNVVDGGGHMRILDYVSGAFTSGYVPRPDEDEETDKADFINCDKDNLLEAKPRYKSIDVKSVSSFLGLRLNEVKELGTCATSLTSKDGPGRAHVIFGQDDGSDVEVKFLRINDDKMWVDVRDTGRVFKATDRWANDDRIEIWWLDQKVMGLRTEPQRRALRQFVIRLADLSVFPGYGYAAGVKLPDVERREGKKDLSILITWPAEQFPSSSGMTLSYAHGDGNATKVMWASSTFKYADPYSLSIIRNLQEDGSDPMGSCKISKEGVFDLVSPPGLDEQKNP